jgi:4-hydroxy-2-oxoheptanedioate aldolase
MKPWLAIPMLTLCVAALAQTPAYQPQRINKAVELLAADQPVYYTSVPGGAGLEEGVKLAQTWADVIMYEMEHGAFDVSALRQFMQGLVKGGPTRSGHRTPAVIVTLPVLGYDETSIRANYWVIHQALAAGVHGINLCHARSPEAVRLFVSAARYPYARPGINAGSLPEGLRGSGSQGFAAQIWGIPANRYLQVADPWPLNPQGEILLGLKIEDRHALANAEKVSAVPGVGFAEWGPGDMRMSVLGLAGLGAAEPAMPAPLRQARTRVLAATRANKVAFLNTCNVNDVEEMIKEGVRVCAAGQNGAAVADKGRKFTRREMPW